ncbi:MAG: rod-binding protein [Gemmobacter sp.]
MTDLIHSTLPPRPAQPDPLRVKAVQLEGLFLAQMLEHAGLGQAPDSFGGGVGEAQFASFLRAAQADAMARRGGIGLAEHLFNAMKGRADAAQ